MSWVLVPHQTPDNQSNKQTKQVKLVYLKINLSLLLLLLLLVVAVIVVVMVLVVIVTFLILCISMDGVYSVQKPEGIRSCKTVVTDSCETSCGC